MGIAALGSMVLESERERTRAADMPVSASSSLAFQRTPRPSDAMIMMN